VFFRPLEEEVIGLRNEEAVPAKTIAVQLIPAGATRRHRRAFAGELPILTSESAKAAGDGSAALLPRQPEA